MTHTHKIGSTIIAIIAIAVLCILARAAFAEETKAPVKTQAVIELEKEMARDVPIYNDVAPRLKMNRAALEQLGWQFDDVTLEARPF